MVAVAGLFFAPVDTYAASSSSTKKQVASLKKQLNKLKNAGASYAQVNKLVKKLSKLDPAKAAVYLNTGLKKLEPANAEANAKKLTKTVVKNVQNSNLPDSKKNQIVKKSEKTEDKYVPPQPTPPPYQASLTTSAFAV